MRNETPGAELAASGVFTFGALLALACVAMPAFAQHEMHAAPARADGWSFNTFWKAAALYVDEGTKRGDRQFALLDLESFGLERRHVGPGTLSIGLMTSLAPLINGGGGVPQLLQTGGTYRHAWLHDRAHPGAAVMQLGVTYWATRVVAQASLVGAPPLGPAPYLHRGSAEYDPLPPLGHHWQDVSHQSFGLVSLGVHAGRFMLEGGAFNARENDENHPVMDFRGARLDSYAGRVTFSAPADVVVTAWTGFLNEPHRLDPATRMHRMGASVGTTRGLGGRTWSSLIVWGMNVHHHGEGSHLLLHAAPGASPHHESHSALAESTIEFGLSSSIFARAEFVEKNGEELGFLGGDLTTLYPVKSIVLGGTKQLFTRLSTAVSVGARASMEFLPEELRATYDTRRPAGFAVFVRLRRIYPVVPD